MRAAGDGASWASSACGRSARGTRTQREETILNKKLYVGNLPFTTTEGELRKLFEQHGGVDRVSVITDRESGRPRGFAFVEMAQEADAATAVRALDGQNVGGRALKVNEASDRAATGGGRSGRL